MFSQGTKLVVKQAFSMKMEGTRGRPLIAHIGDVFFVTNPKYMQANGVKIDRNTKAHINSGYLLTLEQVNTLFELQE